MDELKARAEIFYRLLNVQYNMILGRKNVQTNIRLTFQAAHFHHLIGLQYLKDKPELRKDRAKIFDEIMREKLTYSQISNSDLYEKIQNRFTSFIFFEDFLDSNGLVFRFNAHANPGSRMKAQYILENTTESGIAYLCIDQNVKSDEYFCRSFFPKEKIDYTAGHTRYTLLYKEKVNRITQEKVIQYDRL